MGTPAMSCDNLIRWLDGDWALCFSHPGDFSRSDLESGQGRAVVRDAFAAAGVRPLISQRTDSPAAGSWFMLVDGVTARLPNLPEPRSTDERQVTVLDDTLNFRRQLLYSSTDTAPSLLDLVAATWMLRTAPRAAGRSADARSPLRQEMFIAQIWRGARSVTTGAARAVQLDAALALACRGLLEITDQVDRHLVQSVRAGLQRGLQWLGHDPVLDEEALPLRSSRSLNGGW